MAPNDRFDMLDSESRSYFHLYGGVAGLGYVGKKK